MSFRLALVGHGSSIREIQEIVAETFENIETVGIEMPSDERVDEAAQALRRCLPELDGVLYTRSEPYKLMVSRVDHGAVLARYVNVDAASFVHALLIAQSKYHADIYRVSVDTLDYVTVMKTYRSLELDMDHVQPVSISVDTNAAHFVDATAKTHRESYRSGLCSVCITNIRNVQDTLAAEGIPCVLMAPSPDNYISEVRRLILSWHVKEKAKEGSVIIRIHAELSGDYYLNRKTMVQSVLDLAKLAEQIVLFAQLVSGAYLRMGEQDFAVICSYEVFLTQRIGFPTLIFWRRSTAERPTDWRSGSEQGCTSSRRWQTRSSARSVHGRRAPTGRIWSTRRIASSAPSSQTS